MRYFIIMISVRSFSRTFLRDLLRPGLFPVFFMLLLGWSSQAASVLQIGHKALAATWGSDSSALPPDASIGVSTNHIVEMINGRFTVFRRPTLGRLQSMTDLSFWNNAGISFPSGTDVSDPRVVFDTASQRWFASMIDVDTSETSNRFLIAISATADPTG